MTAREELLQLLAGLSEEEAAACVEAVASKRDRTKWDDPGEDEWPFKPKKTPEELIALLDELQSQNAVLTEEEWAEFAMDFDSHRPHRPLFTLDDRRS